MCSPICQYETDYVLGGASQRPHLFSLEVSRLLHMLFASSAYRDVSVDLLEATDALRAADVLRPVYEGSIAEPLINHF